MLPTSWRRGQKVEARHVPLDRFLIALAEGWLFANLVAEPMVGHHGYYAALMLRDL